MPRPSGGHTATNHATATTSVYATLTVNVAGPRDPQRTPQGSTDTTRLAIVTSRRPEDVETYVGTPYKKNTVAKYLTKIQ